MSDTPSQARIDERPLDAAVRAVEAALDAGADAGDAYVRVASELQLEVRQGAAEHLQQALTRGLGLRVQVARRETLVHTTDLSTAAVTALAAKAVEIARSLSPAADRFRLSAPAAVTVHAHQDPSLQDQPLSEKIGWLIDVERAMTTVLGVREAVSVKWSQTDGMMALANSRGLGLEEPVCSLTIEAEAIAERDGHTSTGLCYVGVPSRGRLPDAAWVGTTAGDRAVMLLGARPVASCKVPVIFPNWMGWTLMVWLTHALRGDHVAQGRSYLADRMGTPVASSLVSISDRPHDLQGQGHRSFDAEGTPTRDCTLVSGGLLTSYLTDLYSAATLGVEPGGHAVRDSYTAAPQVGTSNLRMEPGSADLETIIAATGRGLLVTSLSGWWLNLSPATDIFSSAAMGIWIENGERAHPVRGITVAGTIREMLAAIDMVGSDLQLFGTIATPSFRIAQMAVSGT